MDLLMARLPSDIQQDMLRRVVAGLDLVDLARFECLGGTAFRGRTRAAIPGCLGPVVEALEEVVDDPEEYPEDVFSFPQPFGGRLEAMLSATSYQVYLEIRVEWHFPGNNELGRSRLTIYPLDNAITAADVELDGDPDASVFVRSLTTELARAWNNEHQLPMWPVVEDPHAEPEPFPQLPLPVGVEISRVPLSQAPPPNAALAATVAALKAVHDEAQHGATDVAFGNGWNLHVVVGDEVHQQGWVDAEGERLSLMIGFTTIGLRVSMEPGDAETKPHVNHALTLLVVEYNYAHARIKVDFDG